jgi:hypothetical protein
VTVPLPAVPLPAIEKTNITDKNVSFQTNKTKEAAKNQTIPCLMSL